MSTGSLWPPCCIRNFRIGGFRDEKSRQPHPDWNLIFSAYNSRCLFFAPGYSCYFFFLFVSFLTQARLSKRLLSQKWSKAVCQKKGDDDATADLKLDTEFRVDFNGTFPKNGTPQTPRKRATTGTAPGHRHSLLCTCSVWCQVSRLVTFSYTFHPI